MVSTYLSKRDACLSISSGVTLIVKHTFHSFEVNERTRCNCNPLVSKLTIPGSCCLSNVATLRITYADLIGQLLGDESPFSYDLPLRLMKSLFPFIEAQNPDNVSAALLSPPSYPSNIREIKGSSIRTTNFQAALPPSVQQQ